MVTRFHVAMTTSIEFVQLHIGRLDGQFSAIWHRISPIDCKVHDDLFDLSHICPYPSKIFCQLDDHFDVLANDATEHLFQILQKRVQIKYLHLHNLATTEGQKLPCQTGCTVRSILYFIYISPQRVTFFEFDAGELAVAFDDGEEIIEIMGNTTR